jgi:hypothetical protein
METSADLSHAWQELIDQLHASERSLLEWRGDGPFDPVDLAEGYRFVLHNLRYGIDFMIESDADRPHFTLMADEVTKVFGDNRDAVYSYTSISGKEGARYRITGNRGDACYLSIQSHHGPDRGNPMQPITDDINFRRIDFAPDGSFEMHVGGEKQPRNWLGLDEDATCLMVRIYYFDPLKDRPATLKIERVDPIAPPKPWSPAELAVRLRHLNTFLGRSEIMRPREIPVWNEFKEPFQFTRNMPAWGTPDNAYSQCFFRIADDEALVIEGENVPAVYWNLQLWNIHSQTMDYRYHRICINSRQMKIGSDGRFRAVVAQRDPGVPNWLDANGHRIGFVFNRWLCADKLPAKPSTRLVKLDEVRHLAP